MIPFYPAVDDFCSFSFCYFHHSVSFGHENLHLHLHLQLVLILVLLVAYHYTDGAEVDDHDVDNVHTLLPCIEAFLGIVDKVAGDLQDSHGEAAEACHNGSPSDEAAVACSYQDIPAAFAGDCNKVACRADQAAFRKIVAAFEGAFHTEAPLGKVQASCSESP